MFGLHVNEMAEIELKKLVTDYERQIIIGQPTTEGETTVSGIEPAAPELLEAFAEDNTRTIMQFGCGDWTISLVHVDIPSWKVGERIESMQKFQAIAGAEGWVERNARLNFLQLPVTDPLQEQQWALEKMGAPAAWSRLAELGQNGTRRSNDSAAPVKVAIVDWGVFTGHEDLRKAKISGKNILHPSKSWNDENGHGTLLTGTIAAVANGLGIVGMTKGTEISALKFVDARSTPTAGLAAIAVCEAVCSGAKVINASWDIGLDTSETLRRAIKYAAKNNVTFVAAAGNSGSNNARDPVLPASYNFDNVIPVMASDRNGEKPGFSNYGSNVDIAAPGVDIMSTHPYLTDPENQPDGGLGIAYRNYSGTSASAAHVTGAIALLLQLDPGLKPRQIKEHLVASAMRTPDLEGKCRAGGYLDLRRAILGPLAVIIPRGGERLRRGTLCEVEWRSDYETKLVRKRLLAVFDLQTMTTVGTPVEVGPEGQIHLELPDVKVRRAVIRIKSDNGLFHADSKPFSII
ncbi:S8 family serine peptidase [Nisaea sp.]